MATRDSTKPPCLSNGIEKRCSDCQRILSPSEFHKSRRTADGLQNACKDCKSRMAKGYYHKRTEADPNYLKSARKVALERWFHKSLKKYGLTLEAYEVLADKGCAICGMHPKRNWTGKRYQRLSLDHDHDTGKFRGLLCWKCNMGVGYFTNDPAKLLKAAEYLKSHNGGNQ